MKTEILCTMYEYDINHCCVVKMNKFQEFKSNGDRRERIDCQLKTNNLVIIDIKTWRKFHGVAFFHLESWLNDRALIALSYHLKHSLNI